MILMLLLRHNHTTDIRVRLAQDVYIKIGRRGRWDAPNIRLPVFRVVDCG
jgi:hypothetical protein